MGHQKEKTCIIDKDILYYYWTHFGYSGKNLSYREGQMTRTLISIMRAGIFVIAFVLISTVAPLAQEECGDADNNGVTNLLDINRLLGYLYMGSPAPPNAQFVGLIDGYSGITNNDLVYLINHLERGGPQPVCSLYTNQTLPVTDDSVYVMNRPIPAFSAQYKTRILVKPANVINGYSLVLSFISDLPSLFLDSISFVGAISEDKYSVKTLIDNENMKFVIAFPGYVLDTGLLATLHFSGAFAEESRQIIYEAATYPPEHTTIFSKDGYIGVFPTIVMMPYLCGDANNDGAINLVDVAFVVDYLYRSGPPPSLAWLADVDFSGATNILDIAYLISYLYKGGPEPHCQ